MKRRVLAAVVVGLVFFTACTGTENAAPRARNSTLGSVDVKNGNFAAGGGGWLLAGVELGAGCNASGGDPSLGSWKKNALAFGYRKSTVTQSVVIPNPSTVVLKIDGAVRFDQSDSTFVVDLKSMTQAVSTGTQTGAVLVTPQTFTLSVTTTAPNESVTISATGNSSKFWAGCYGPMLSNASITVTPNASPIVINDIDCCSAGYYVHACGDSNHNADHNNYCAGTNNVACQGFANNHCGFNHNSRDSCNNYSQSAIECDLCSSHLRGGCKRQLL